MEKPGGRQKGGPYEKRVLNLEPIGGNVWRAELVTPDGTQFVAIVQAPDQRRAWELAMEMEPDAT